MAEASGSCPGKGWYLLAGFVAGASVLVTGILGTARAIEVVERVYDYERFYAPGSTSVTVAEPGDYSIYYEYQSGSAYSAEAAQALDVALTVTGPDGSDVPVRASGARYGWGSRKAVAVGAFDAAQPGDYLVRADLNSVGTLAVGESVPGGLLRGFGPTLFVGVGLVLASLVLTVAVAARRRAYLRGDDAGPPAAHGSGSRIAVVAGVGVVVVVAGVVGAVALASQDDGGGTTSLEPVDPGPMDWPTPEELRETNLAYADRMGFTGDQDAALAVADEVRTALTPLAGVQSAPTIEEVQQALAAWDVTVSSNAVRTSGTAFGVAVDGGCVFGSVHDGVVDVEVGGYLNDGGCLASYGH